MGARRLRSPLLGFAVTMAVLIHAVAGAAPSIPMSYCSSLNTASMASNTSIWQSDGLCHDFCNVKNYALAVVQADACWCSDYLPDPSIQVSTSKCSNPCPGFPDDICGGDGLFGYMQLSKAITGTQGLLSSASASASASATTSTTAAQPTITPTKSSAVVMTQTETVQNTVINTVTANPTSQTSSSSSSLSDKVSTTPTPSISTVTADGTVRTVTVTPSATLAVNSPSSADITSGSSGGLSTGAAVGVAIVVVAILAALIGASACCFIRRRRRNLAEEEGAISGPSTRGSSAGFGSAARSGTIGSRSGVGADRPQMAQNWPSSSQSRRNSHLTPVDPRMDSFNKSIYARPENRSHESFSSLRDDFDYSRRVHEPRRVLRTTNPDSHTD